MVCFISRPSTHTFRLDVGEGELVRVKVGLEPLTVPLGISSACSGRVIEGMVITAMSDSFRLASSMSYSYLPAGRKAI